MRSRISSRTACAQELFDARVRTLALDESMHRGEYYRAKLSAHRLCKCYEIAPPRIKQYLDAEIEFVVSNVHQGGRVLELGCGYGRVMRRVSPFVSWIAGNDISKASLNLVKGYMEGCHSYAVFLMNASRMAFRSGVFDVVFCIQNGISAFGMNPKQLIAESVRVAKDKGVILFSSYSPKIWQDRLEWFRRQAESGLIGEIDEEKTGNGAIVCKDGFRATTISGARFAELFNEFGLKASIVEVDESSLFCKVVKECARV